MEGKQKATISHRLLTLCSTQTWLTDQKEYSGLDERDFYLQVQLDGSVRASGCGMPPWNSIVSDLPPLDDIRTKLTDNIGF